MSEEDRTRTIFGLSWRPRDALATDKPWHDWAFWTLQGIVIALYLARFGIESAIGHGGVPSGADFTTIAIFVWPVLYAAVTFGPTGGTFTTALVAALSVPRLISFAQSLKTAALLSESIQVLILCVIALVVGRRVAAERNARIQADDARRAHRAAEARYRGLFRTNSAPILLVDASGKVMEANAAALSVFGGSAAQEGKPRDLVDLVGTETARRLLRMPQRNAGSVHDDPSEDNGPDPGAVAGRDAARSDRAGSDDGVVVRTDVDGAPLLYRADATRLEDATGQTIVQLVLHDVTIETLRQQWMEAYAARVLFAQEEERRHIAQELHDGPLQALVHLCRRIDAVGREDGADLSAELEGLRRIAESLVGELRGISRGLRPSVLDDLGLVAATRRLLEDLERRTGIDTSLGISGTERRLPIPVELALFRVAQEAITNAEHHADPRRVAVGMSFEPAGVRLLVSDDGEGFSSPAGSSSPRGSLGLVGMRERLHIVGGRVEVHSKPGSGTTVDAWASTRAAD